MPPEALFVWLGDDGAVHGVTPRGRPSPNRYGQWTADRRPDGRYTVRARILNGLWTATLDWPPGGVTALFHPSLASRLHP